MGSSSYVVIVAAVLCAGPLAPAASAAGTPPSLQNPPAAPAATPARNPAALPSDAARHAKRTQCLKEARAKKIVGARRTAFVHACLAQP